MQGTGNGAALPSEEKLQRSLTIGERSAGRPPIFGSRVTRSSLSRRNPGSPRMRGDPAPQPPFGARASLGDWVTHGLGVPDSRRWPERLVAPEASELTGAGFFGSQNEKLIASAMTLLFQIASAPSGAGGRPDGRSHASSRKRTEVESAVRRGADARYADSHGARSAVRPTTSWRTRAAPAVAMNHHPVPCERFAAAPRSFSPRRVDHCLRRPTGLPVEQLFGAEGRRGARSQSSDSDDGQPCGPCKALDRGNAERHRAGRRTTSRHHALRWIVAVARRRSSDRTAPRSSEFLGASRTPWVLAG